MLIIFSILAMMWTQGLVLLSLLLVQVEGYPTGAPAFRCESMTPGHGTESTNPNPYSLQVSSTEYTAGQALSGKLHTQPSPSTIDVGVTVNVIY